MQNAVNYAAIIIDDPLLQENYGFLNYCKLLSLMDKHNFHTTIAFIPWNYNRTDKNIATLFRERPDRFSMCVHGCDHTRGEFGSKDVNHLNQIVKLATSRMIEHEKRTGVHFDRVMVFPQGIFSNESLDVLKNNDYLAAVNTEALPINGNITSNFPFFLRYTPENAATHVLNPMFIVLHHDYFKDGYANLVKFVDELNIRMKNIRWDSVGNIIRNYLAISEHRVHDTVNMELSGLSFHGYKKTLKIGVRRYLCEFRDNYLSKNDTLLNHAKKLKALMHN
jgi:hypothetical protein